MSNRRLSSVESILNGFKSMANRQMSEPLKGYTLKHGNYTSFNGVNLKKIFLAHSFEEAIVKIDEYLKNNTDDNYRWIEDYIQDIRDITAENITDYLTEIRSYIENNRTLWIEEFDLI